MKAQAKSKIWFPGMDQAIVDSVNSCSACQAIRSKPPQNNNIEWSLPTRPWSKVHLDYFLLKIKYV